MSEHSQHRRRRSSGFDLPRMYRQELDSSEDCYQAERSSLGFGPVIAVVLLVGLLLGLALLGFGVFEGPIPAIQDNELANPLRAESFWSAPSVEGLLERLLSTPYLLLAVLVMLVFLAIIVLGVFYTSGGAERCSAEPSAFHRRLEDMVNIKVSRRPRTRKRRHRHAWSP